MSAPPPPPPPPPSGAPMKIKAPSALDGSAPASAPKRIEKPQKQLDFLDQLKAKSAARAAKNGSLLADDESSAPKPSSSSGASPAKFDFMSVMKSGSSPKPAQKHEPAPPVAPAASIKLKPAAERNIEQKPAVEKPAEPAFVKPALKPTPQKQQEETPAKPQEVHHESPAKASSAKFDFMSIMKGSPAKPAAEHHTPSKPAVVEHKDSTPSKPAAVQEQQHTPSKPAVVAEHKDSTPSKPAFNLKSTPVKATPPQKQEVDAASNELANKLKARQIRNQQLLDDLNHLEKRDEPKWRQEEELRKKEEEAKKKIEEDLKKQEETKRIAAEADVKRQEEMKQKFEREEEQRRKDQEKLHKMLAEQSQKEIEQAHKAEEEKRKAQEEQEKKHREDELKKKREEAKNKPKSKITDAAMDALRTGNNAFQKNDTSAALDAFSKAIQEAPTFSRAYMFRGICNLNSRKTEAALADFSKAIEHSELEEADKDIAARSYLLRGKCYKQANKFPEAIADLTKSLDFSPNDAAKMPVYLERAICYDYSNKLGEAVDDYKRYFKLLESAQQKPTAFQLYQGHHNFASALVSLKQNDEALEHFTKACIQVESLSQDPQHDSQRKFFADSYFQKGKCNEYKGNTDAAIEDYKQATSLFPSHSKAYYQLANLYYAKHAYQEAVDGFTIVIDADSNDFTSIYNRGMCYKALHNLQAAQNDFMTVQEMKPSYYRAFIQCARVLRAEQDSNPELKEDEKLNRDIIEQYSKAIESVMADGNATDLLPALYFERANVRIRIKEFEEAISDFAEAIKLDHVYVDAFYNRAYINHHELKNYEEALHDLNKVLEFSTDAETLVERGMVLYKLDKTAEAVADWEKALELQPGNEMAQKYLEIVKESAAEQHE